MSKKKKEEIIIKNAEQLEGIRRSSKLAAETLDYIEPFVKEGVSTEYLDDLISEYTHDHGAVCATLNYHGFPKSSCISINDVVVHGIPSPKDILRDGDIVNIDVTPILDGYFGDTNRMFEIGTISEKAEELLDITYECMCLGIERVAPGNYIDSIGVAISHFAAKNGYSVVQEYCGHGVGLEFHEEPVVEHHVKRVRKNNPKMLPGMVFTIEPMINIGSRKVKVDKKDKWTVRTKDGSLSAQYEHTVLVTETGCEVLTDNKGDFEKT